MIEVSSYNDVPSVMAAKHGREAGTVICPSLILSAQTEAIACKTEMENGKEGVIVTSSITFLDEAGKLCTVLLPFSLKPPEGSVQ